MKFSIIGSLSAVVAATYRPDSLGIAKTDIVSFLNGLLYGLANEDNLTGIEQCLQDGTVLEADLQKAIISFQNKEFIAGIKALQDVLAEAEDDLADCQSMSTDWQRVKAWREQFSNPVILGKIVFNNAIQNREKIFADVQAIIADGRSDQANDLGLQIADLAINLVGKIPSSELAALQLQAMPTPTEIYAFVNALVDGLVLDDNLNNITTCVKDVSTITKTLLNLVEEFKKNSLDGILQGATDLGLIVDNVQKDLAQCTDSKADAPRLEKWAVIFQDPSTLARTVSGNILSNSVRLFNDANQIAIDFDSQNYAGIGHVLANFGVVAIGPVPTNTLTNQINLY